VYRPDGKLAYQVGLRMPSSDSVNLTSCAMDSDGVAVVGIFDNPGGPPGSAGLIIVRDAGKAQQFVDTGAYVPEKIAVAADRIIWTLGHRRRGPHTPEDRDFRLVRKYTPDGNLAGEFLPASLFPPVRQGQAISGGPIGDPLIAASADRVGVYHPGTQTWLELDFAGNLTGHWTLPLPVGGWLTRRTAFCAPPKSARFA
jgi:hypothetical protein